MYMDRALIGTLRSDFEGGRKVVLQTRIFFLVGEMLYSLIVLYVGSNNSEYFGGYFSISIFLLVSMLGFDSFDAGVNKTYFHSGSNHFQITLKHMNKVAKIKCIVLTFSTLFISSI